MSHIIGVSAHWTKSVKFALLIAVQTGGLAKNHFWLVATQKKRIGEPLYYFLDMCPKPFSWAKMKENLFSRGLLIVRVALKIDFFFNLSEFRMWLKLHCTKEKSQL